MTHKIGIVQRITILIATIILLQLTLATVNGSKLALMGQHLDSIDHYNIPLTALVTKITEHQLEQEIEFERAMRYAQQRQDSDHAERGFTRAFNHFEKLDKQVDGEFKAAEQLLHEAAEHDHGAFSAIEQEVIALEQQHRLWSVNAQKMLTKLLSGQTNDAMLQSERLEKEALDLQQHVIALLGTIEQGIFQGVASIKQEEQGILNFSIVLNLIAVVVIFAMAWFIIAMTRTGLQGASQAITRIAEGDLVSPADRNQPGELGQALRQLDDMRASLHTMFTDITAGSKEVLQASDELSTLSQQVADSVASQNVQVEQVATAVNEMSATALEIARHAEASSKETKQAVNHADASQLAMGGTVESINQLSVNLDHGCEKLARLEEDGKAIGGVLDVIKSIAEQTNLLALNAAIEAARAGEQGRGFAVVADEVRTLAQRTQQSTTEIAEMIERLYSGTQDVVESMEKSRMVGDSTKENARETSGKLAEITQGMNNIEGMSVQVASASEEQSAVIEEININISAINAAAADNTQAMSGVAAASEQLSSTANRLQDNVERFTI